MAHITVVTSTIGRPSLLKLAESLSVQGVRTVHLVLWDKKRLPDGVVPDDPRMAAHANADYSIFHYVVDHELALKPGERIDNHLRAVGVAMSTTERVAMIDDDCWVEPGWFLRALGSECDYCYCRRALWESETLRLGVDTYESLGHTNAFGYALIDMNTLVFRNMKAFLVTEICNNNNYVIDRHLATRLADFGGTRFFDVGINQISPDFLLEFHKAHIKQ